MALSVNPISTLRAPANHKAISKYQFEKPVSVEQLSIQHSKVKNDSYRNHVTVEIRATVRLDYPLYLGSIWWDE